MNPRKYYGRVYDAQVRKIYRYIRLKVGSSETAEDLTAQVFERGWVVYSRGADPDSDQPEIKNLRAFLYQLARHAVADYYRVESRQAVVHLGERDLPQEGGDLAEREAQKEETRRVLSALSRLSSDHQDLIIQRYLNGLSVAEMAVDGDRSVGAIKTALHRAREALKKELGSESGGG